MSCETELAWAAGFFDGEGCISVLHRHPDGDGKKHEKTARLEVSQLRHEPLRRWRNVIGCGRMYGPYPGRSATALGIQKRGEVLGAIGKLWPYLSEPKREQILRVAEELAQ